MVFLKDQTNPLITPSISCWTSFIFTTNACLYFYQKDETISVYDCSVVEQLNVSYGAVIMSAVMDILFSFAAIILLMKLLSWKRNVHVSN